MVRGDIFTSPIDFALQEMIKQFENYDNDNDKMSYELVRRSRAMWENIRIYGLDIYGMTYEQFCNQFDKKKNIVFDANAFTTVIAGTAFFAVLMVIVAGGLLRYFT